MGLNHRDGASPWRAGVFDCDGLLVDSAACWQRAYERVVHERGGTLAGFELAKLAGASAESAAQRLTAELGVAIDKHALRGALFDCFAEEPPALLPGAADLVQSLASRMPLAVATNAPRELVTGVLAHAGVVGGFETVVSAEDVGAGKPAPDVYLEACRRLDAPPYDAVAFEDSPAGARAARSAGMVVVGVPSLPGLVLDADLIADGLDDPALLGYLGLVPARG